MANPFAVKVCCHAYSRHVYDYCYISKHLFIWLLHLSPIILFNILIPSHTESRSTIELAAVNGIFIIKLLAHPLFTPPTNFNKTQFHTQ